MDKVHHTAFSNVGSREPVLRNSRAVVKGSPFDTECHMCKCASVHAHAAMQGACCKEPKERAPGPALYCQSLPQVEMAPRPVAAQALHSSGLMLIVHHSAVFCIAATRAGCPGWTHDFAVVSRLHTMWAHALLALTSRTHH
jgi:hypothetical protein